VYPLLWTTSAAGAPVATAPTELAATVVGPLCELTLRRRFRNEEEVPIDTELWFALPVGGAVDQLTVTVGERVMRTRVVGREQAAAQYVQAANEGRLATVLEQQDRDLVMQRIANVLPGEDIEIELRLVAPVERHQGVWQLAVPLTVAPRLQDPGGEGPVFSSGPEADPLSVPLRDRVDATVQVQTGLPIRWIESPSHAHRTQLSRGAARLWVEGAVASRDLVVRWSTAVPEATASLLVGDGHGLLLLEPPAPWVRLQTEPADIVLLVDGSDTMYGARWERTQQAVGELLAGLREQDTFTLLVFADVVRGLAVREPATAQAVAAALLELERTPLGGTTNLALGLRFAQGVPTPPGRPRTIVLLSDGGAESAVVQQLVPGDTVHTVGIGASPNRALLQALASAGHGVSVVLSPEDEVQDALAPVLDGLGGPVLTEANVDFGLPGELPQPLPPLYADRLVTLPVRGLDCERPAIVRGSYAGEPFEQRIAPTCTEQHRPLAVLWALSRIEQLETAQDPAGAAALALEFELVTRHTSLLGLDSEIHNAGLAAAHSPVGVLLGDDMVMRATAARSYETLIHTMPGVAGAPLSARSSVENVYLLDGSSGRADSPTLQVALTGGAAGSPQEAPTGQATGSFRGPLVRDRLWLLWDAEAHEARMLDTGNHRIQTRGGLTFAPRGGAELSLRGEHLQASLSRGEQSVPYGRTAGALGLDLSGARLRLALGAGAGSELQAETWRVRVEESLALGLQLARHELGLDGAVSWWSWSAPGLDESAPFGSVSAEETWRPGRGVTLSGAMRVDVSGASGELLPSPSLLASWEGSSTRASARGSVTRDLDRRLPEALAPDELQVPRTDSGRLDLAQELVGELWLGGHAEWLREQFGYAPAPEFLLLPDRDVAPVDRTYPRLGLGLSQQYRGRWDWQAGWTVLPWSTRRSAEEEALLLDPWAAFVPAFLQAYRRHQLHTSMAWTLPIELTLGGRLKWQSAVEGELPDLAWLAPISTSELWLAQEIPLRRGALQLELSGTYSVHDPETNWLPLATPLLLPGAPGIHDVPPLRAALTLGYGL
jgi:Ca-activated chloride channel family protein